ncbi:MAG TPA: glycosyltransferase family 4 protein [Gaiellaceae bacterium]|nr:glycosyltransferase family 4 protein [Gaiellaceae bacterium]
MALVAHGIHDRGGMERAFAELVRGVHDEFDLVVISSDLAEELRPLVTWRRTRAPERPLIVRFPVFLVRAGLRLRREDVDLVHTMGAIVANRVDLVSVQHCHAGFRAATGRLAPRGVPALRRVNTSLARAIALASERWCYRPTRVRALAPVSRGVAAELERHYPGIPLSITPNGVDVERFSPNAAARAELRTAFGSGDDAVVALFVGGNWDLKGLAIAIEAVAMAERLGSPMTLWVVGDGPRERFEKLARDHGVGARVRFFGPRDDTERFYAAADVFVLPTQYEAFPLVALEAAASGMPLIVTRVNGIEELLSDDRGGILVERDAQSVGAALARLAPNPAERARIGADARANALDYTWARSVEAVRDVYRTLLGVQA